METALLCSRFDSAVGEVWVIHDGRDPAAIRAGSVDETRAWCARHLGSVPTPVVLPAGLRRLLEDAAAGRGEWRPRLAGLGEFQRRVLLETCEIPAGEVRTYAWLAERIGRPGAARAVGGALARNPLPLLVPCHRVVRGDGHIRDYGCGGSEAKRALLAAEGVALDRGMVRATTPTPV